MTPCAAPSTKASNTLLHVLAKRTWQEYGGHNWDKYEELCRVSTQSAATFSSDEGLDLRNTQGKTALMVAAAIGNDLMAFELVRKNADVNAVLQQQDQPDRTAMDMAACAKRSDIIDMLKRHGGYGLCEKKQTGDGFQKKSRRR